jgi:hypothetical protein
MNPPLFLRTKKGLKPSLTSAASREGGQLSTANWSPPQNLQPCNFFQVYSSVVDPDPHHFGNLDPHPDPHPHQIKTRIRIRMHIK